MFLGLSGLLKGERAAGGLRENQSPHRHGEGPATLPKPCFRQALLSFLRKPILLFLFMGLDKLAKYRTLIRLIVLDKKR